MIVTDLDRKAGITHGANAEFRYGAALVVLAGSYLQQAVVQCNELVPLAMDVVQRLDLRLLPCCRLQCLAEDISPRLGGNSRQDGAYDLLSVDFAELLDIRGRELLLRIRDIRQRKSRP